MNKVIVTGANGFLGRWLLKELVKNDVKVFAIIRPDTIIKEDFIKSKMVEVIYCDMNNYDYLIEKIPDRDIDVLYHFSWAGTSGSLRGDIDLQLNNVRNLCSLVAMAKKMNIKRIINPGSIMEYEFIANINQRSNIELSNNIYSIAKITANQMAKILASDLKIEFISTIISNIFGPYEYSKRFVISTLEKLLSNQKTSFTNGEQLYDFIYVSDAARAFYKIGFSGTPFCDYYIGNKQQKTLKEFLYIMRDCVDKRINLGIGEIESSGKSLSYKEFDTNFLYEDTDFDIHITFEEGIKLTLEWLKFKKVGTNYE